MAIESKIYNKEGKETGNIDLPESVFGLPWNGDLVHQVFVSMMSNARQPIAHTKGRSEVRGGGKKPWRQKGTGRARHGSIRSPIWRGGGVTFGPTKEKNYDKKINKKMKTKALFTIMSRKFKDGELIFVDNLDLTEPKTKEAKGLLVSLSSIKGFEDLSSRRNNSAYIAVLNKDEKTERSFRNLGNVELDEIRNLNPLNILNYKYIIISEPKKSLDLLEDKIKIKKKVSDNN